MKRQAPPSVDAYIDSFPETTQAVLRKIRTTIKSVLPNAEETISYQIPTFKLDGKYVVYFAGFAKHVSVYPLPTGDTAFQQELSAYKAGKGTAKFPLAEPIPYLFIKTLVRWLLKERHEQAGY